MRNKWLLIGDGIQLGLWRDPHTYSSGLGGMIAHKKLAYALLLDAGVKVSEVQDATTPRRLRNHCFLLRFPLPLHRFGNLVSVLSRHHWTMRPVRSLVFKYYRKKDGRRQTCATSKQQSKR